MNKTLLILVGLLMVVGVGLVSAVEDYNNYTISFASGGTFQVNYSGLKNFTNSTADNWIRFNDDNVFSNFSIGAGENWALLADPTGCTVPYEDISITTTTNICNGIYYFKDSGSNGALIAGGHNILINGNNATLIGNGTLNKAAFYVNQKTNITIQGFTIKGYSYGIQVVNNGTSQIFNNTFINNTKAQIIFSFSGERDNTEVVGNNIFIRDTPQTFGHIYLDGVANLLLENNTFIQNSVTVTNSEFIQFGTSENKSFNITINNNNFTGEKLIVVNHEILENLKITNNDVKTHISNLSTPYALYSISGIANLNISGDRFHDSGVISTLANVGKGEISNNVYYNLTSLNRNYAISFITLQDNISMNIHHNIFNISDTAIVGNGNVSLNINNNKFDNILTNADIWRTGIRLERGANNTAINNNTFYNIGSCGILIRKVDNVTITNNSFYFATDAYKQSNIYNLRYSLFANDIEYNEPTAAICVLEIYKSYLGDSSESSADTISKISGYRSSNITILGNTFDSNTQTFLRTQGTTGVRHDLSNYWYRKYQAPTELVDIDEFYNNNLFDSLHVIPKLTDNYSSMLIQTYNNPNYNSINRSNINFTISKTLMTFKSVNNVTRNVSVYNLTSPYNDIKNTSNGVILAENQASYSITLSPNQQIEIGQFQSENLTSSFTINGCYATLNNVSLNNTAVQFNYSHVHPVYTYAANGTREIESSLVSMVNWVPLVIVLLVAGLVIFLIIKNYG